jgi:hypothetical protein
LRKSKAPGRKVEALQELFRRKRARVPEAEAGGRRPGASEKRFPLPGEEFNWEGFQARFGVEITVALWELCRVFRVELARFEREIREEGYQGRRTEASPTTGARSPP